MNKYQYNYTKQSGNSSYFILKGQTPYPEKYLLKRTHILNIKIHGQSLFTNITFPVFLPFSEFKNNLKPFIKRYTAHVFETKITFERHCNQILDIQQIIHQNNRPEDKTYNSKSSHTFTEYLRSVGFWSRVIKYVLVET